MTPGKPAPTSPERSASSTGPSMTRPRPPGQRRTSSRSSAAFATRLARGSGRSCCPRADRGGGRPAAERARRDQAAGRDALGDPAEALHEIRGDLIEHPVPATLGGDGAGVPEDLQVMGNRRLRDVAARGEVAGADLGRACQLAEDLHAGWIREGGEELDVWVGGLRHGRIISMNFDIDKHRYQVHIDACRYSPTRQTPTQEVTDVFELYPNSWPEAAGESHPRNQFHETALREAQVATDAR